MAFVASRLLQASPDVQTMGQILAVSTKEVGAWLHAFPSSSLGLRMDDDTVCIAVSLRLGGPHTCCHCEEKVGHLGVDGLSCRRSKRHHYCHGALNSIIHRPCLQLRSLHALNLLAFIVQMRRGLMECHGRGTNFLFEMPRALIYIFAPSYAALARQKLAQ